jgi:hypothetical protein
VTAPSGAVASKPRGFVHDGFYLRFAVGAGYGRVLVQTDRVSQPDVTQTGFSGALDVWAGYSVAPGFVVGPGLSLSSQGTKSASMGDKTSSATGTMGLLSVFIDAYPSPQRGEHFGGLLAIASLRQTTDDGSPTTDYEGGGLGLFVFAGYDAWIGREWSLGALCRMGGVATRGQTSDNGEQIDKQGVMYEAALLVSVLHH